MFLLVTVFVCRLTCCHLTDMGGEDVHHGLTQVFRVLRRVKELVRVLRQVNEFVSAACTHGVTLMP